MRREYIEDLVLVLGGATVIAGAWIVYWPAGLIVAGLVMILLGALAYKHHGEHAKEHAQQQAAREKKAHESMSAAAWRFHVPSGSSNGSERSPHRSAR